MTRDEAVHDTFVYRWASRYLEIEAEQGERSADLWATRFLNEDDLDRVAEAVVLLKEGGSA